MAEEQQQQGARMPKVGTLVSMFFSFFVVYALVAAFSGCLNQVSWLDAARGAVGAASEQGRNACSIAFMVTGIQVAGWFLGLAGTLFDYSILAFVVSMGSLIGKNAPFANGIVLGWTVLRDFVNLAFIGGLIYAAISLILRINTTKIGELIVRILVAALLVNFSFFFGAVIIDASNIVSQKIYQEAIYDGPLINPFSHEGSLRLGAGALVAPVSERFMAVTRLGSLYALRSEDFIDSGVFADNNLYPYIISFFGVFLFSLTAGVFITAALFLFIRFVIIMVLMVTSPIGILYFTGIPALSAWGKAWWGTLFAQALFPIVFLLMVAVSFKIMELGFVQSIVGDKSLFDLVTSPSDLETWYTNLNLVVVFFIAWLLMYFSIRFAANVAQQKPFDPPSPARFFAMTQGVGGQIAKWTYPRTLAYRTAAFGLRKGGEVTGISRTAGGVTTAIGRAIAAPFKGPEGRVAQQAEDIRKDRLKDIASKDPANVTKEEREEWGKAPERLRGEVIRNNPKLHKNIAHLEAGASAPVKSAEKKAEESEQTSKAGAAPGTTSHSAAAPDSQRRIEQVLQTLQQTEMRELGMLKYLTANELTQTLLARRELIADARNARRLADTLGKNTFDGALLNFPTSQFSAQIADAVGGQIGKLQTYSTLRRRLATPERGALDAAVERDNPGMRRLYNTSPGGMFE